jgi:hypothetical protein
MFSFNRKQQSLQAITTSQSFDGDEGKIGNTPVSTVIAQYQTTRVYNMFSSYKRSVNEAVYNTSVNTHNRYRCVYIYMCLYIYISI